MGINDSSNGFIVLCDREGVITEIIRNEMQEDLMLNTMNYFQDYLEDKSNDKYHKFYGEVFSEGSCMGWEMNVQGTNQVIPLSFSGLVHDKGLIILAAESTGRMLAYYEELVKLNNEHVNVIRGMMKKITKIENREAENDQRPYDKISTLNNELLNTQRELTKINVELKRLNVQKNEYLGMAAHDLRNPIGNIMAYSEILKDELTESINEEQQEIIATIHQSSEYMLKLIDDFLDVSKIQVGKLILNKKITNLCDLVKSNVSINQIVAQRKEILLTYECYAETLLLDIDPIKMNQVLNNLISNSIKFSYARSEICVRVKIIGGDAVIEVIDQGLGISKEDIGLLFKPYSQTRTKSTKGEKGEGLGLAIAKKIANGHGGDIFVESEEGKGTKFLVSLPIESTGI